MVGIGSPPISEPWKRFRPIPGGNLLHYPSHSPLAYIGFNHGLYDSPSDSDSGTKLNNTVATGSLYSFDNSKQNGCKLHWQLRTHGLQHALAAVNKQNTTPTVNA